MSRLAYPLLHPSYPHCYNSENGCRRHRTAGIVLLVLFHVLWVPTILAYACLVFDLPGPGVVRHAGAARDGHADREKSPEHLEHEDRALRGAHDAPAVPATHSSRQADAEGSGAESPTLSPPSLSHQNSTPEFHAKGQVKRSTDHSASHSNDAHDLQQTSIRSGPSSERQMDVRPQRSSESTGSVRPVAPSVRSSRSSRFSLDLALDDAQAEQEGPSQQTPTQSQEPLSIGQALALRNGADATPTAPQSDSPPPNPDFLTSPPGFGPPTSEAAQHINELPHAPDPQSEPDPRPPAPLPRPAAVVGNWPLSSDELWCDACQDSRPARAHHCRRCGYCIERMDHHCVWIYGCVGQHNHRLFWTFLLYTSCMELLVLSASIWSLARVRLDGFVISLLPLAWWFGLFTSILWGVHTFFLTHGMTTMEQMRIKKRAKESAVRIKI